MTEVTADRDASREESLRVKAELSSQVAQVAEALSRIAERDGELAEEKHRREECEVRLAEVNE